jgi:hypothetical protein
MAEMHPLQILSDAIFHLTREYELTDSEYYDPLATAILYRCVSMIINDITGKRLTVTKITSAQ